MTLAEHKRDKKKTAIVIGGGVIGLTTAYSLSQKGVKVTVIDPGFSHCRASTATAGIIGGSSVIPWASSTLWPRLPSHLLKRNGPLSIALPLPADFLGFVKNSLIAGRPEGREKSGKGLANLGLRGWDYWQSLLVDLPEARSLFKQTGCLFFCKTNEQLNIENANNIIRREFSMDITDLCADEMKSLIPSLKTSVAGGSCVNLAGHVTDPLALQEILKKAILLQGAKLINSKALGFKKSEGKVKGVRVESKEYRADTIILSAGAGSAGLAKDLGNNIPMVPAWGASVTFTNTDINLKTPFLVLSDGFAVTSSKLGLRVSGLLQIGGEGKVNKMTDTLIYHAKRLFGNFRYSKILRLTGPRPLTADSLPFLGQDPYYSNIFHNFGHGHWGLTHAAVSAKITTDLVLRRTPEIDISAYKVNRY